MFKYSHLLNMSGEEYFKFLQIQVRFRLLVQTRILQGFNLNIAKI